MEQVVTVVDTGKLRAWYQASRAPFFVATLVPLALAGVIAYKHGGWNTTRWIVICLASFLVHMIQILPTITLSSYPARMRGNPSEAVVCFRMESLHCLKFAGP